MSKHKQKADRTAPQEPKPGLFASLGNGAKWLGGIVVVALVGALVPLVVGRLSGPEELGAKLDKVGVRVPVTLAQFKASRVDRPASFEGERRTLRLVAAVALETADDDSTAQSSDRRAVEEPVTPVEPPPPPTTGTTVPPTPSTVPDTATTPERDSEDAIPNTATTSDGTGDPVVTPRLRPGAVASLSAGITQAVQAAPSPITLPGPCLENPLDERCGLNTLQIQMGVVNADGVATSVSPAKAERRLTAIFAATRTRPARSDPSKRELIGITVDFNVQLTGFRGQTVDIRWELLTNGGDAEVPRALSGRERVLLLKGQADKDTAGDEFWVPMPKAKGPYIIRVGVYNQDNTRLDFAVTEPFT